MTENDELIFSDFNNDLDDIIKKYEPHSDQKQSSQKQSSQKQRNGKQRSQKQSDKKQKVYGNIDDRIQVCKYIKEIFEVNIKKSIKIILLAIILFLSNSNYINKIIDPKFNVGKSFINSIVISFILAILYHLIIYII